MMEMAPLTQENTTELVDEIFHSIFFLGEIYVPQISPGEIFANDAALLHRLKKVYPGPFRLYSSSLPRRSPFSCVLDMVVHLEGQENEEAIRDTLRKLVTELMIDASSNTILFSSTMCISAANSRDAVKHYGVSMSSKSGFASRIMVAASCLSFWEEPVVDAVMSYYLKNEKRTDFKVTIKLPTGVRCDAFKLTSENTIIPCLSCNKMFGLATTDDHNYPHGNCAEAESLSNLLRENEVRVQRNGNWTEINKKRLRCEVRYKLTTELRNLQFGWDDEFYVPQRASSAEVLLLQDEEQILTMTQL
ncbi:uncharacterized protein LOC122843953 [Gambusia affinis]|uniref:uncharacterized protein LOC122843953 n=1 Tax=Gambusia affinis TaxID=33528 RepID=UPI001CDB9DC4|nr:uncharacterized protein LOC122843953 [Gambusia affinis]